MTMGTGLFLLAVGAILRYAVKDEWDAVNLETVGLILMIVGVIGFIVGAIYAFGRRREAVVSSATRATLATLATERPPRSRPGIRGRARPRRRSSEAPHRMPSSAGRRA